MTVLVTAAASMNCASPRMLSNGAILTPPPGLVTLRERPRPGTEDLLNLATVHALRCRGRVHVFDGEGIPGKAAIAPIFRYRPSRWQAERARPYREESHPPGRMRALRAGVAAAFGGARRAREGSRRIFAARRNWLVPGLRRLRCSNGYGGSCGSRRDARVAGAVPRGA